MQYNLKNTDPYKQLMSQASQCTLQVLDKAWKSFSLGMREWKKDKSNFLGMPQLPKYKNKNGRFPWFLKNNQTYIKDGYLNFRLAVFNKYKFKTKADGRLISVRFIPRGTIYVMEIVYEKEINPIQREGNNIIGIDLGVNNFATIVNNIGNKPIIINGKVMKSINQYYNKERARLQSELNKKNKDALWSKRLDVITRKRFSRIKNHMHHASKFIIKYCLNNNIDTIVIGHNDRWKQNSKLNSKVNQEFIFLPYNLFIDQIRYKAYEYGINVIENEESYTSGTSFLDGELPIKENYNKSRRKHRGLFVSNKNIKINADVNGALQIIRKVFPNAFADGIEGSLVPIIINVA